MWEIENKLMENQGLVAWLYILQRFSNSTCVGSERDQTLLKAWNGPGSVMAWSDALRMVLWPWDCYLIEDWFGRIEQITPETSNDRVVFFTRVLIAMSVLTFTEKNCSTFKYCAAVLPESKSSDFGRSWTSWTRLQFRMSHLCSRVFFIRTQTLSWLFSSSVWWRLQGILNSLHCGQIWFCLYQCHCYISCCCYNKTCFHLQTNKSKTLGGVISKHLEIYCSLITCKSQCQEDRM